MRLIISATYTNDVFGLTQVLVAGDDSTEVVNLFGLAPANLISQDSGSEVRTLRFPQGDYVPFPAAGYYPFGKHIAPPFEQE